MGSRGPQDVAAHAHRLPVFWCGACAPLESRRVLRGSSRLLDAGCCPGLLLASLQVVLRLRWLSFLLGR